MITTVHNDIEKSAILRTLAIMRGKYRVNIERLLESGANYLLNIDVLPESLKIATEEYQNTERYKGQFVPFFSDKYPPLLRFIPNPPLCLIALGNIEILQQKSIAMVGSRAASYNGLQMADFFSKSLSNEGWVVVSGLAKGIDAKSHIGAIKSTIAVIGSGISSRYPAENTKLYDEIIANNSCIITEFSFDVKPIPANFPQRNRIIAGISHATLIVEAGMQSGSLVTARLAREFNREVFAIPGFALDEKFRGNNYLIKKNIAKLVESIADISDELADVYIEKPATNARKIEENDIFNSIPKASKNKEAPAGNNQSEQAAHEESNGAKSPKDLVLSVISTQYISTDEICRRSGLSAENVSILMMELELEGLVISNGINGFCRKFK